MHRRDFLKKAAIATTAAAISPELLASIRFEKEAATYDVAPAINKSGVGSRMKLSFYPYDLVLRHTFTVSSYSRKTTPTVQLAIEYEGYTGYGEASLPPYLGYTQEATMAFLRKVDLSGFNSPFLLEDILDYVDSIEPGQTPAKAAIDIALHDLVGKLMDQPLYRILGLTPEKAPSTSFTIGIDTPDIVRQKTLECAEKYNILKVKVGYDGDDEMVRTIREVTDLPLVVDANQGWTDRQKALNKIYWLYEQGVRMAEQPMPKDRLDDIAWLTERSPIPIIADESCQRLVDLPRIKGAFTGINIKLMKSTGIREAMRMMAYARAEGMMLMIGCMTETSCAVSAAAALSPLVDFADLDGNLLINNDIYEGVMVKDGILRLPDRPGLGLIKK